MRQLSLRKASQQHYMTVFKKLFQPVDNSSLILFRILFGALLAYHFSSALSSGTIYKDFIKPPFTFPFIGFEFLHPLPGNGMYFYIGVMIALALMIMLGAWYRISMICFSLLWTILYLMQKSDYNNHYYLVVLLCWLMVFMPANRFFSVDVKRKAVTESTTCSRYFLLIFIAQMAVVYFFAAISKINADWFSGKFISIQLSGFSHRPKLGLIYGQKWFQRMICYGGFLFDLLIVPLLLWKRTRKVAFIASCLFHLFNSFTFSIGIFPYLSIALNLFFLSPKTLRRLAFRQDMPITEVENSFSHILSANKILVYCLGVYFLFQVFLPMRSWLYPGNVFWNEEGYRMSWKMMLRAKRGSLFFKVTDPASGKRWKVEPAKIFAPNHANWIAICPDMVWQYSQQIKRDFTQKGFPDVQVFAVDFVSLNRSEPAPLVDSTVNLAAVKWQPFRHSNWVTKEPGRSSP